MMAHVVATFLFFVYANTNEQRHIFDSIINAVNGHAGGMFFLYGLDLNQEGKALTDFSKSRP